jgi:ribokinase
MPLLGETLPGQDFYSGFGGKGANQAVMAARLGAHVTMVSRVGNDFFGTEMLRNFQTQGIDTAYIQVDPERPSGVAAIMVDDAARNSIIVVPGANMGLTPEDVRKAKLAIDKASVLLTQLETPVETALEAFRLAKMAGVRTILNPAPARPIPPELLRAADICAPNETEIAVLTGKPVTTVEEALTAAEALRQSGQTVVILTLGERGVVVAEPGKAWHVPSIPVEAIDPTGAGDAFLGSLAVFLAEGISLPEAIAQANSVAALSVTRPGTQTAFPTRQEMETFQQRKERR